MTCDLPTPQAAELESITTGKFPADWEKALPTFTPEDKGLATRLHSQVRACRGSLQPRATACNSWAALTVAECVLCLTAALSGPHC